MQKKQTEVEAAQARLAGLQARTGAAYESYNNALFQLNQLDDKIAGAKKSRAAAQKDVDGARKSLQEQASRMYKSGNVGFMDVIVGARSFSEFTGRLDLWIRLLEQDRAKLEQVRNARDRLAREERSLEAQRKQRVKTLNDAASERARAVKLQSQAQDYFDSLGGDLARAIRADQARQAEQARQAATRAAANVKAAPSITLAQPIRVPEAAKAPTPEPTPAPQATPPDRPVQQPEAISQAGPTTQAEHSTRIEPAAADTGVDSSASTEKVDRLAGLAVRQAAAKKKAADLAAARQKAADEEAARVAAAKQATADQVAAAQKARRDAEAAARRAAVEKAAADRKAAEQEAAKQAAEQAAAERAAVRRDQLAARRAAAAEQARQQVAESTVGAQHLYTDPSPGTTESTAPLQGTTALSGGTTQAPVPQETTAPTGLTQSTVAVTPPAGVAQGTTIEAVAPPPDTTAVTTPPPATTEAPAPQPDLSGGQTTTSAPASSSGSAVVAEAQTWLGVPYVWGGASRSGVDCSGLTMLVFARFGISLPHSAAGQYGYGSPGSGAAGDLVFMDFQGTGGITHVGIATGDGQMINAPYPGTVVRYDPIYPQYTIGYRTLL